MEAPEKEDGEEVELVVGQHDHEIGEEGKEGGGDAEGIGRGGGGGFSEEKEEDPEGQGGEAEECGDASGGPEVEPAVVELKQGGPFCGDGVGELVADFGGKAVTCSPGEIGEAGVPCQLPDAPAGGSFLEKPAVEAGREGVKKNKEKEEGSPLEEEGFFVAAVPEDEGGGAGHESGEGVAALEGEENEGTEEGCGGAEVAEWAVIGEFGGPEQREEE